MKLCSFLLIFEAQNLNLLPGYVLLISIQKKQHYAAKIMELGIILVISWYRGTNMIFAEAVFQGFFK